MSAAHTLSEDVGKKAACEALEIPRASFYRRQEAKDIPEKATDRLPPPLALSQEERQAVLDQLHSPRFIDSAPREIYASLLDEGRFMCSVRTMYRILSKEDEVRERRRIVRRSHYEKPELLATAPNQVWSWDITKLKGPVKWTYYYLYVIMDIYSRYVVGWMIAHQESQELAKQLIQETSDKQGIMPGQLTIHADRGSSMTSKAVALLLSDLGITKTHSRPYVSNDNPYSESQFKTMKYRPEFPSRFGSLEDARLFCQSFFSWYNDEHYHSGIGLLTPKQVHFGQADEIIRKRQDVLREAFVRNPNRFKGNIPKPLQLPAAAWINKPTVEMNNVNAEILH